MDGETQNWHWYKVSHAYLMLDFNVFWRHHPLLWHIYRWVGPRHLFRMAFFPLTSFCWTFQIWLWSQLLGMVWLYQISKCMELEYLFPVGVSILWFRFAMACALQSAASSPLRSFLTRFIVQVLTTVTIDELAPGFKTIFSFVVPVQRTGKVLKKGENYYFLFNLNILGNEEQCLKFHFRWSFNTCTIMRV